MLENALKKDFAEVSVEVVDSPDLTQDPFYLASSGIFGDATIIEYGNDDYLIPLVDKTKVYDLIPTIREIESYKEKDFFACGAGAGPFEWKNQNCEGVYNMKVFQNGSIDNESRIVKTTVTGIEVLKVPNNETRAALLGNIFLTEGKSGEVLKVVVKRRIGEENFISSMRKGLTEYYSVDEIVGIGGVFVMKKGTAHVHVMDDFSQTAINTDDDLNNWLTFHQIQAPLIALGDFVSQQTDFQLRFQHFHCFSMHNQGGHYHYDVTPEIVEYEGYFNVARRIILIDKNPAIAIASSSMIISLSLVFAQLLIYLSKTTRE